MPVPKRKTSKSRRDQRSACKFIRPQAVAACEQCAAPIMPHIVCEVCGYYKGRKVLVTKVERSQKRGDARRAAAERAGTSFDAAEQMPAQQADVESTSK